MLSSLLVQHRFWILGLYHDPPYQEVSKYSVYEASGVEPFRSGAAERAEIFNKIPKLCKLYLKNGENSYCIGDRKNGRYPLFFAVLVGKTDFNTQKPVSEKNTL